MRRLLGRVLLTAGLLWPFPACGAQEFTARVIDVADGDTLTVLRNGRELRVRIFGVDAPEAGQPYGNEARAEARRLLQGRSVVVRQKDVDSYDRIVAELRVGGRDVGAALLAAGAAWDYAQFSDDERYAAIEAEARRSGVGLWRDRQPVPPWDWRAAARASDDAGPARESTPYVGNVRSRVLHARGCPSFGCPNCTEAFTSEEAARQAGYRAHSCVRREAR